LIAEPGTILNDEFAATLRNELPRAGFPPAEPEAMAADITETHAGGKQ
jgi:hypothetical protein